jgi:hypothetical protein
MKHVLCRHRYASLHNVQQSVRLLSVLVGILCCVFTCWYLAVLALCSTVLADSVKRIWIYALCVCTSYVTSQKTYLPVITWLGYWLDGGVICFRYPGRSVDFVLVVMRSVCLSHSHSNPVDVGASPPRHDTDQSSECIGAAPPLSYMSLGCA